MDLRWIDERRSPKETLHMRMVGERPGVLRYSYLVPPSAPAAGKLTPHPPGLVMDPTLVPHTM